MAEEAAFQNVLPTPVFKSLWVKLLALVVCCLPPPRALLGLMTVGSQRPGADDPDGLLPSVHTWLFVTPIESSNTPVTRLLQMTEEWPQVRPCGHHDSETQATNTDQGQLLTDGHSVISPSGMTFQKLDTPPFRDGVCVPPRDLQGPQ